MIILALFSKLSINHLKIIGMGKGDVKSKKGKIAKGSFGNSRPHKTKQIEVSVAKPKKSVSKAPKK